MSASEVMDDVKRAAHGPWMARAASFGFVAQGVVYGVIGIYALMLAAGRGGAFLDAKDAPGEVRHQPFGVALLVLLGLGLACHALWRFIEALESHPREGAVKRTGERAASIGGGLVSAFLAVTAFQHLAGHRRAHGSWVQRALRWDGGDWLIIAVGAGFIAAGGYQLYRAYTQTFRKDVETREMSDTEKRWLMRISRFGVAARGAVLIVVGWLFMKAGLDVNGRQATGTGAALRAITRQTWGMGLLAIVATGLMSYALFMLVNARYRAFR